MRKSAVLAAVLVLTVCGCSSSSSSSAPVDSQACNDYRSARQDLYDEVLTGEEMRERFQEISEESGDTSQAVQDAARDLLASATQSVGSDGPVPRAWRYGQFDGRDEMDELCYEDENDIPLH